MRCAESKHAVATGNTITENRSFEHQSPEEQTSGTECFLRWKQLGMAQHYSCGAALPVQQGINNAVSQDTGTAADVKDITEHPEPEQEEENKEEEETKAEDEDREEEKRVEEEKEIELELEQELEPETEPLAEEEEAEPGRFTSHDSPDHYFSPRRDEEVPEGIVSEGLSSEYNLPRHEQVKEGEYDKVVVEEKNPTGLEKEEELRKKEDDSAPDERTLDR